MRSSLCFFDIENLAAQRQDGLTFRESLPCPWRSLRRQNHPRPSKSQTVPAAFFGAVARACPAVKNAFERALSAASDLWPFLAASSGLRAATNALFDDRSLRCAGFSIQKRGPGCSLAEDIRHKLAHLRSCPASPSSVLQTADPRCLTETIAVRPSRTSSPLSTSSSSLRILLVLSRNR